MEVTVGREVLLQVVSLARSAAAVKSPIPIFEKVLLDARGDTLEVTGTDLDVGVAARCPATVKSPGALAVSAQKLDEVARVLSADAPVRLHVKGKVLHLRHGSASYQFAGLDEGDYPRQVPPGDATQLRVSAGELIELLARTKNFAAQDSSRPSISGILFDLRPGEVRGVATDAKRLSVYTSTGFSVGPTTVSQVILPRKAVPTLERLLGAVGRETEVEMLVGASQVAFRTPQYLYTARLLEGPFPKYEAVIPETVSDEFVFVGDVFRQAVRQVSMLAEDATGFVTLRVAADQATLNAKNEAGVAEVTCPVIYEGPGFTVGLNVGFLEEAVASLGSEEQARFGMTPTEATDGRKGLTPCKVTVPGHTVVLMPMVG